jgi:hypothetical protein
VIRRGNCTCRPLSVSTPPPDNFGSCLIRDSIKTEFPIPTGAGYRVDAKPFAPTQTPIWVAMYSGITVNRGSTSRGFNSVMLGVSDKSERIQLRWQRGRVGGGGGWGERKCVFFPHKKTAKQTNKKTSFLRSSVVILFELNMPIERSSKGFQVDVAIEPPLQFICLAS